MHEFLRKYPPDNKSQGSTESYERAFTGFTTRGDRVAPNSGSSFGGGIYRLYDTDEIDMWTSAVHAGFPSFANRVRCFGRDWLCNQFCLDKQRPKQGEAQILLFEIGTGQVLKIPETFDSFHLSLLDEAEATLAKSFYSLWRSVDTKPLSATECVGYKIPLFLGGTDEVSNLERSDASVYWHLTAQLLPPPGK